MSLVVKLSVAIAVSAILAIALGVGLGVGLNTGSSSSSSSSSTAGAASLSMVMDPSCSGNTSAVLRSGTTAAGLRADVAALAGNGATVAISSIQDCSNLYTFLSTSAINTGRLLQPAAPVTTPINSTAGVSVIFSVNAPTGQQVVFAVANLSTLTVPNSGSTTSLLPRYAASFQERTGNPPPGAVIVPRFISLSLPGGVTVPTQTPTATAPRNSPSAPGSPSVSRSNPPTPTVTGSMNSQSGTRSSLATSTPSGTKVSPSRSFSPTRSLSSGASASNTATVTATGSITPTVSATGTVAPSFFFSNNLANTGTDEWSTKALLFQFVVQSATNLRAITIGGAVAANTPQTNPTFNIALVDVGSTPRTVLARANLGPISIQNGGGTDLPLVATLNVEISALTAIPLVSGRAYAIVLYNSTSTALRIRTSSTAMSQVSPFSPLNAFTVAISGTCNFGTNILTGCAPSPASSAFLSLA